MSKFVSMSDHNQQNLGSAIDAFIKSMKLGDKYYETKLKENWEELMGPSIAKHTNDIYLKNGMLFIHLDSAPLKQELTYHTDRMRSNANEFLATSAVKEIVIK